MKYLTFEIMKSENFPKYCLPQPQNTFALWFGCLVDITQRIFTVAVLETWRLQMVSTIPYLHYIAHIVLGTNPFGTR